ncbi:MAG: phosphatase PAP2 family protein [Rectinema subterraneum]|uniref:phosphatase PAP2 family protein n=1 Tax=Rectinema subterraneum TaxID=2653714 RepID=UPI003C7D41B8
MAFIESMHAAELQFIKQLQSFLGLGFRIPMQFVSFFASEAFVIAVVPVLYWCIHRKKGAEFSLLILGSAFINLWVKQLLAWPRPYEIIPSLALAKESTYGMPSGHSQLSVVFWAFIAEFLPAGLRVPAMIIMPLLIGFSRIYLGVHFPSDVVGGYIIGVAFFGLFKAFGPKVEPMLRDSGWRLRVILAAALSFIMNLLSPSDTMISGAFLGASIGFTFASRNVPIDQRDDVRHKLLRYLAGLATTGIIYLALKFASSPLASISGNNQEQLIRFIRYALVGGWVSYGAPFMFLKLGLAKRESS